MARTRPLTDLPPQERTMWQPLLRNWLMGQARQRMREAAAQAAGEAMPGQPGESPAAEPPEPQAPSVCHVGIVFAMSIEAGAMVDRLSGMVRTEGSGFVAREGGLDGRRVVIIESGAGRDAAARATEALILGHEPRFVISAGFAGALDERLHQGDILMADSLADPSGGQLGIDLKFSEESSPHLHVGRLLTVDRVVRDSAEKRVLGTRHHALAVDMETMAVAQTCKAHRARFLSVRVISDDVERTLPRDIDRLVNSKSTASRLGVAAGAIFRRPGSIKDMWQLKEDALVASQRLAKFLVGVIGQLPKNSDD